MCEVNGDDGLSRRQSLRESNVMDVCPGIGKLLLVRDCGQVPAVPTSVLGTVSTFERTFQAHVTMSTRM
jgi:hypothetical protein